jgi:hypothetical protein
MIVLAAFWSSSGVGAAPQNVIGAAQASLTMGAGTGIYPETCISGTDLAGGSIFAGVEASATQDAENQCGSNVALTSPWTTDSSLSDGLCQMMASAEFVCE